MEDLATVCVSALIDDITFHLTGVHCKSQSVVKVNNENLLTKGDLCFLPNLKAWRCVFGDQFDYDESCATILQHCSRLRGIEAEDDIVLDEQVLRSLISISNAWSTKLGKCTLQRGRVCLFLDREHTVRTIIISAIKNGFSFGQSARTDKKVYLEFQYDEESELSSTRLRLIRDITARILTSQGYLVSDEVCSASFVFTSKSHGKMPDNCERYVCGVVKDVKTNAKITSLTWEKYLAGKSSSILVRRDLDIPTAEEEQVRDTTLSNMAKAIAIFELIAVKPSRSVFVNDDMTVKNHVANTRGASFVLYNTARIATIIEKHEERISRGTYPSLLNVEMVDFSLLNAEEEWELVYNFILGYPQLIRNCVRHEPTFCTCPQDVCLFLLRLCQKFSVYYRKTRILTEGYDHLYSKMVARIYMLKALKIVLENALGILDIESISRM